MVISMADLKFLILCALIAVVCGSLASLAVSSLSQKSAGDRIKDFYLTESAVGVSPADFTASLNNGNPMGLAVDLRSKSAYDASHLSGAVNVPAESMDVDQLVTAFSKLPKDKPIITYCYSSYCMLSIHVGEALAEHGIFVKHMNLGWQEMGANFPGYMTNGTGAAAASEASAPSCSISANATFSC